MEPNEEPQTPSTEKPVINSQPSTTIPTQQPPRPAVHASDVINPSVSVQSKPILKPMTSVTTPKKQVVSKKNPAIPFLVIVVLFLGAASGYGLALLKNGSVDPKTGLKDEPGLQREVTAGSIKPGTKVGVADERTFKDNAEGTLQKGGIDGEGSHHLVRPGGESQTLYITSSIIDLDQFVGHKVKIWGETLGAQKAGWLMDVGKLEVLE